MIGVKRDDKQLINLHTFFLLIKQLGFFAWFGPVWHTPDAVLIDKIGYDATLFIKFIRMIRRMLYVLTFVGVCVIIPVNIVATSLTG